MANTNNSANMSLPIPVTGVDAGPDYANNINASLTLIDGHDHSAGKGVPINPAGLNINSDLSFNGNNLTLARSLRLQPQGSTLSGSADLGCLYESGVDLYYNDGSGNQVRITQSGGVAGSPGSIANLASPASASYVSANSTFVWQSAANTPANLDAASVLIRNLTANSKALTLSAPSAMGANYTITLPSLPSQQNFMTLDNSGNMSAPWNVDNSSIQVSSNVVQVKAGGITNTMLAALNYGVSSSCGSFNTISTSPVNVTNLSVTVTTVGRPVAILLQSDGSGSSWIGFNKNLSATAESLFTITRDGTAIAFPDLFINANGASLVALQVPPGAISFIDSPGAGTHVYVIQAQSVSSTTTTFVNNCVLFVYEI